MTVCEAGRATFTIAIARRYDEGGVASEPMTHCSPRYISTLPFAAGRGYG